MFKTYGEALNAVSKAIDYYNRVRPHMSCNYLTPNEAYTKKGALSSKWKKRNKVMSNSHL
ncbi:integrase core domain-containing protein [Chitinophaga silvisoli]|uniref:Integrase catalytic domain-containing protein n=1 Tax=Chitinophaga silvisoli TaxID=2291814 RepID=A0A3E1P4Z5_9BACT|nr:hypothetical protein DXN04_07640 [Chitinophaga silvisoli]